MSEKILAGFAGFGFRAAARGEPLGGLADDPQVGFEAGLAQLRAPMGTEPSAPLALPVVKRADLAEQEADLLRILIGGFDELAPHMRPAGGAGNRVVVSGQTLVGFVAVGLEQPLEALFLQWNVMGFVEK